MKIASASAIVNASSKKVLEYVSKLASGKKKYVFDTHLGFEFIQGSLYEPGSFFYTREKFMGRIMRLDFQVIESKKDRLTFRLLKPYGRYNIHGTFEMVPVGNKTKVRLDIFTKKTGMIEKAALRSLAVFYKPIIKKQITKEIKFVEKEIASI
ncbi:hypothetical protein JXC34_02495 [Candidatus Woesearchaeota archaeon]|nr:hypothetical protein [Candidatus Woesearchaeota archaeon]